MTGSCNVPALAGWISLLFSACRPGLMEAAEHLRPKSQACCWPTVILHHFGRQRRKSCLYLRRVPVGSALKGRAPDPAPRIAALLLCLFCSTNFRCGFRQTVFCFPDLLTASNVGKIGANPGCLLDPCHPPLNPINSSVLPGRAGWTAWKADTDIDDLPPLGRGDRGGGGLIK